MKSYSTETEVIDFMNGCIEKLRHNSLEGDDIAEAFDLCVFYHDHPHIQHCVYGFLAMADEKTFGKVSPILKQRMDSISRMHH